MKGGYLSGMAFLQHISSFPLPRVARARSLVLPYSVSASVAAMPASSRVSPLSDQRVLLGMSVQELQELAVELGEQSYRGKQIHHLLYQRKVKDVNEFVQLPQGFRNKLQESGWAVGRSTVHQSVTAADGTIKAGWAKWRGASGVLCDRKIPLDLKGKVYRVVVRPAMLYGAECWPLTKLQEQRLMVAEMRMLRWMCGLTRMDRIKNDDIRRQVGVAAISDKLRESRLRWLGHVLRRQSDAPVRRCEGLTIANSRRSRERPKKSWREVIRRDLELLDLREDMAFDRTLWRERTRAPDGG